MTMMRQDQMPYYIPPQQFDPTQWFGTVAQVPQIRPQPSLAEIIVVADVSPTPRGITTPVGVWKRAERCAAHATFTAATTALGTTIRSTHGIAVWRHKKGGCGFNQDQSCETPATLKRSWQPCPARASAQLA
jgi:hypothetical protein